MVRIRLLLFLLIFAIVPLYAEQDNFQDYEDVDLVRCFDALKEADADGDGKLTAEEHVQFLQKFGPTDYWVEMEERPLELRAKFNAVACMCIQRGGDAACCLGDNAYIDLRGILEESRQERDYLQTVCILTQRAIDEVERERFKQADEAVSVWLRSQYDIVVTQGNSQTEEELLEDLGQAMNLLVEEVLAEETSDARRQRRLQEVEYLPTRLEATPIDCQGNMPSANTCSQIDTITYVVGPQEQLDQAELETALDDAIASGRLQEIVDEVNPDSYLRVMDQIPTPPPTGPTAPPRTEPPQVAPVNEEPGTEDVGQDWSTGAITGLVLAGAAIVALAAGLAYGRRRLALKKEESKLQKQASQQGSIINMELVDNTLEHDLDDLEKGNGGGGMLGELSDVDEDSRYLSYKLDQVGLEKYEDDALPPPPPADPTFVVLPFEGKRPQSTKEPSEGDLGASYNVHMDSHNSSSVFAMNDRKASSGSIGGRTPVSYRSAMGIEEESDEDEDSSDDDSSAYTSSLSSEGYSSDLTEGDTDSQASSSSSGSSEYDEYGSDARLAEVKSSLEARALEENDVAQDAPAISANNAAAVTGGAAAVGGASFYASARDNNEKVVAEAVEVQQETNLTNSVPSPPEVQSRAAPGAESTGAAVPEESPSTGLIAGVAGATVGAIALGGAAIYAATRSSDEDKDERQRDDSNDNKEGEIQADTEEAQPSDSTSSPPQFESTAASEVGSDVAAVSEAPKSTNPGVIAGVAGGAVGAMALGGAAIYAATKSSDDRDDDDEKLPADSQDRMMSQPPPPLMESESQIDDSQPVTLARMAVAGAASFASIQDPVAVGEDSHVLLRSDQDDWSADASKPEMISSLGFSVGSSFDGPTAAGEDSQMIDDPVAVGEESQMMENDSSLSAYTSGEINTMGSESLGAVHGSIGGSTTIDSGSTLVNERHQDQIEDSTMLRPPPRPPSPTDEGPTLAAAAAIGTVGAAGVAAAAALVATRGDDEEDGTSSSDSASNSSSESDDESNSTSDSSSESDQETNTDSQLATVGTVESNGVRPIDERPRPTGSDHPYYSTAAAMSAGGALGSGAVYDFDDSDDEYSTSSSEPSTDSEGGSDTETTTSNQSDGSGAVVAQSQALSTDTAPVSVEGSEAAVITRGVSSKETHDPNTSMVQDNSIDGEKSVPTEASVITQEAESRTLDDPSQSYEYSQTTEPSNHQESDEVSTSAVVLGGVMAGAALAGAAAYTLGKRDDEPENDLNSSETGNNDSLPTEAAVVAQDQGLSTGEAAQLSSESTETRVLQGNDDVSTGAVVLGAAAAGTALVGAATYILCEKDDESEDDLNSSDEGNNDAQPSKTGVVVQDRDSAAMKSTQTSSQTPGPSTHQGSSEVTTDAATAAGAGILVGASAYALRKQNDGSEDFTDNEPATLLGDEESPSTEATATGHRPQSHGGEDENDESDYSTERTTDDESGSSEDESTDFGTDVGVAGSRSMSRSTLSTSLAGTQSVSRSTLATSGSSLQGSYQGQDASSRGFYARDNGPSLSKTEAESGESENAVTAQAINSMASSTNDFEDSSSSESSSEYDSDSSDEYYSSGSSETSVADASNAVAGLEEEKEEGPHVFRQSMVAASLTPQVQVEEVTSPDETMSAAMNVPEQDSTGLEMSASATLTESGDTFLAMEEAAHAENPEDVAVTKTRFAPVVNSPAPTDKAEVDNSISTDVAAATIGAGVLGAAAVATLAAQSQGDEDSGSDGPEYSGESSSSSDSSDSSSYTSSSSGASSSDSDTSSESGSSVSSSDDASDAVSSPGGNISQTNAKPASILAGASGSPNEAAFIPKIVEENVGDPNLRSQLKPVKSEGAISRKRDSAVSSGPGARAQLLRARSDAMLSGSKRDETLQALLTSWDNEYDITTGDDQTTTSSEESLLVKFANEGLPSIEEAAQSDESSQSLSLGSTLLSDEITAALRSGPLPEDAIRAAMQHGSSSLLNFDYSLRTVAEEQSGEVEFDEESSGDIAQQDFARSSAVLDENFEAEILRSLDPIQEKDETQAEVSSRNISQTITLAEADDVNRTQGNYSGRLHLQSSGSYSQSSVPDQESVSSSDESSSSSESSSEYTTSSSSSSGDSDSEDSDSTTTSGDSSSSQASTGSSSSGSPAPSWPNSSASLTEAQSSSLKEVLPSLGEQVTDKSTNSVAVAERNALADSQVWAAIAQSSRSSNSERGATDAAEWAIKQSLSALKIVEERATSLASSSASSSESSNVSFSSDYASSSDDDSST